MNRRTVLGVCGVVATTGCLSHDVLGSGPITNRDLTAYDSGSEFYNAAPGLREPPKVTFKLKKSSVLITGKLYVGSSSCNKAALKHVAYDTSADTLRVTIGSGEQQQSGNACTADESADAYRARITFADQLPATVEATENGSMGDIKTTAQNPHSSTSTSS